MCLYVPGEGEAVGPGEEIPQPDGGKELPQVLHCNARGERATEPLSVCSEHTLVYTRRCWPDDSYLTPLTGSDVLVLIILDLTWCNRD